MAKYTFDTVTVADMLDTPEILALIEASVPEVLEHPLLEVGRSFIFSDALPYVADMVTEEQIEAFRVALEALE